MTHIPEIILASTSPRRMMLLKQIGIAFKVNAPNFNEIEPSFGKTLNTAEHNALEKCRSVANIESEKIVISADTIVDLDGEPLGKPKSHSDAKTMLSKMSGKMHIVYTAVGIIWRANNVELLFHDETKVWFRQFDQFEIDDYVATGEPMDKAGAYGIQERGALLIRKIDGCFFNVMGLPLPKLWEQLRAITRE